MGRPALHAVAMQDVMTRRCRTIGPRELAAEAVQKIDERAGHPADNIYEVPVQA